MVKLQTIQQFKEEAEQEKEALIKLLSEKLNNMSVLDLRILKINIS